MATTQKLPVLYPKEYDTVSAAAEAARRRDVHQSSSGHGGLTVSIPSSPAVVEERKESDSQPPSGNYNINVRNSSSLPPTRVASPRMGSVSEEEEKQHFASTLVRPLPPQSNPVNPYAASSSASASRAPLSIIAPSPSPTSTQSSLVSPLPASRAQHQGLTPHGSRPPIPKGRVRPAPSAMSKFAACFNPPVVPSSIFDLQLTSLVDTYKRLPAFLDVTIQYLNQNLSEGATFFTGVPESRLQEIVNYLEDAGEGEINIKSLSYYGVAAVGAFLMRFLEQLPEPLLTHTRYEQWCVAANIRPTEIGAPMNAPGAPSPALRAAFPILTNGDTHDQLLLMQSMTISLPGAHYLLLQRLVELWRNMLDFEGTLSPDPSGQRAHISIQRLSLLFSGSILVPLYPKGGQNAEAVSSRRAQEQQVVTYLINHYSEIFCRNPIRLGLSLPKPVIIDPNPKLQEAVDHWRHQASSLKLKFARRFFDDTVVVRVFRAWRAESRSNRRRAEAYRQLALLKKELLEEKQKTVLLTRELHGLREEYELRDFQDQLRLQTGSIGSHGYSATRIPMLFPPSTLGTGANSNAKVSGGSGGGREEEKMAGPGNGADGGPQNSPLRAGLGAEPRVSHAVSGGAFPRDLSNDLAAVRALQEQDRILTQTYSRYQ